MPVILKMLLSTLLGTLGKMVMKYLVNEKAIEELVIYGLEQLVKYTESKVDDELLAIVKAKVEEKNHAES